MRGLRKYLTPFAPDQSGAVGVLYELGGLLVVIDAGGCVGNICGFDEPRWEKKRCAIFSAGLRDMDAIFGRDDRLIQKVKDAAAHLSVSFIALVGTPVPAVIGTDYQALARVLRRETGLPVLSIETDGTGLYDVGEEKAYRALFRTFAVEKLPVQHGRIGVLGATPMNVSDLAAPRKLRDALTGQGRAVCYGMGGDLEEIRQAAASEKNLVVSPGALAAARDLQERFGTPYEVDDPLAAALLPDRDVSYAGARVLVVQQQVRGNALRKRLRKLGARTVCVASWFLLLPELREAGDIALSEEEDLISLVGDGAWDVICADGCLRQMIPDFAGRFIDCREFAVSGKLREEETEAVI